MSDKAEELTRQIAELARTVQERDGSKELQWDDLKAQFSEEIDALVETKFRAELERQPVRRLPGNPIYADGNGLDEALKGNRYARMLTNFGKDGYHRVGALKAKPFDLWLAWKVLKDGHAKAPQNVAAPSDDLRAAIKALDSTTGTTGDELVPTDMAPQLWEDFFLASRVAGTLTSIDMPTNPFDIPLGLGDVTWRKGTENTATTASDPATAKSTLTATELVTEQNWSYTLDEDAVVAMAPAVRARLAISGAEIIDSFALNADATNAATGNINLDDADPDDASYYLTDGQDGIRHQWLASYTASLPVVNINAGGDALADGDVTSALAAMRKYAADPNQLVIVCDVSTYLKGFLNLDGVVTLDKFGPDAVLLTGQLASYRGIPVVVSASHPLAEADGKVSTTASNNTLGSVSIYNKMMWYLGFRRDLLMEVDRDIQKRQIIMVTSLREAIAAHGTRTTVTHTSGIRNISIA